jgi:hypothetical protein
MLIVIVARYKHEVPLFDVIMLLYISFLICPNMKTLYTAVYGGRFSVYFSKRLCPKVWSPTVQFQSMTTYGTVPKCGHLRYSPIVWPPTVQSHSVATYVTVPKCGHLRYSPKVWSPTVQSQSMVT